MLKPAVVFFITLITVAILGAVLMYSYVEPGRFTIFVIIEAVVILLLAFAFMRSRRNNIMNQK